MTFRPALMIAIASIVLAACGGGSSDGAETTIPEITLITTTSEAPPLEDEPPSSIVTGDDTTTTPETEVATTIADDVAVTTDAVAVPADTTLPPPPETTIDTVPAPATGDFVLGPDGLGSVRFGSDPEQAITFVSSVFGPPTRDTGWVDPFEIGPCGGTRLRQVSWNQLQLEFGDVSDVIEGRDHFYAYFYGAEGLSTPEPAGLQTAEKIGAGSSVAALLSAYPGLTLLQGDEFVGPSFIVNDNLNGRMSGITDADVVEAVIGGRPCDG